MNGFFFPERASEMAGRVDLLYAFLIGVSAFFTILIFALILVFAVRYRRRSDAERPPAIRGSFRLEIAWTIVPLVLSMIIFAWGADVFFDMHRHPPGSREIYVTGKQWMWIVQHPEGRREINELHVPAGSPIKLTLISEDVIHSFFVPAFRVKMDVLPGRYTSLWFEATKPGSYHLFCAEYCGTEHSLMVGKVVVMRPVEYEDWLSGGVSSLSLAERGEKLFTRFGCVTCHGGQPTARGPVLTGLWGKAVELRDGSSVTADEAYLREAVLEPAARVVAGYEPIMPTYKGQINEEGLIQILAYLESLGSLEGSGTNGTERP